MLSKTQTEMIKFEESKKLSPKNIFTVEQLYPAFSFRGSILYARARTGYVWILFISQPPSISCFYDSSSFLLSNFMTQVLHKSVKTPMTTTFQIQFIFSQCF